MGSEGLTMTKLSKRIRRMAIVALLGIAAIWLAAYSDPSRHARDSVFFAALLAVVVAGAIKDKADS